MAVEMPSPNALGDLMAFRGLTNDDVARGIGVSEKTIRRWKKGKYPIRGECRGPLAELLGCEEKHLAPGIRGDLLVQSLQQQFANEQQEGLEMDKTRRSMLQLMGIGAMTLVGGGATAAALSSSTAGKVSPDLLLMYEQGVISCQNLYHQGKRIEVTNILPLYRFQTGLLAEHSSSPLQKQAARLASQAQLLEYELAAEREDFHVAKQALDQALSYAESAEDVNLQIATLISRANLGFHRKNSTAALQAYEQAISLFGKGEVTPLSMGRTLAGISEIYAMRQEKEKSMRAMGMAYDIFPEKPEQDAAFPYLRADRYSLYVFGDVQARLFLGQPNEAETALSHLLEEMTPEQMDPATMLDLQLYQAEITIQQGNLEAANITLQEGAQQAKNLNSRLYFNKLADNYITLQRRYPDEPQVKALAETFAPW